MKQKHIVKIICVIITAIVTIIASYNSGTTHGIKQQDNNVQSQIVSVDGNNNTVMINDVDTLIAEYNKLISENETLRQQNKQYFNDYIEQKDTNSALETKLDDSPDFLFSSIGLCIDGNQIPINTENSIVDINGREYWSKEIVTSILPKTKTVNIKDSTLYIGQIIADPVNLFDQFINYSYGFKFNNTIYTDSYGNPHSNCVSCDAVNGSITFVLNNKYSKLKIGAAINSNNPYNATFLIKADDTIVYTSDEMNVKTEPFIVSDIPLNNCNLLTIEYDQDYTYTLVLYDAVLYN